MRPSSLNPGLMADFKRSVDQDPEQGIVLHEAMHKAMSEVYQAVDQHKELAELLPEPAGGYRANLITFSIRCHVLGADKREDFRQMLAVERVYHGINQMSFRASRQNDKSGQATDSVRGFLGNWLNYIEQAVSTKGA